MGDPVNISVLKTQFNLQNVNTITVKQDPIIIIPEPIGALDEINFYKKQITTEDQKLYDSKLGTPVLTNLVIEAAQYTDENGTTRNFPRLTFDTVLMTVANSKEIVKSKMQGRRGTVKQYIALGDYDVTINGIITGSNGVYPKQDVSDLKNMLEANIALNVSSWWLQIWDVDQIVVEDYEIPQISGGYSYQPFSIRASSDQPIELEVINQ